MREIVERNLKKPGFIFEIFNPKPPWAWPKYPDGVPMLVTISHVRNGKEVKIFFKFSSDSSPTDLIPVGTSF